MSLAIITGSAGLIGSEAVRFFGNLGMEVIGIDNDMRKFFFGEEASTKWNRDRLKQEVSNYQHYDVDIRDYDQIEKIFQHFDQDISLIIHRIDNIQMLRNACYSLIQMTKWNE